MGLPLFSVICFPVATPPLLVLGAFCEFGFCKLCNLRPLCHPTPDVKSLDSLQKRGSFNFLCHLAVEGTETRASRSPSLTFLVNKGNVTPGSHLTRSPHALGGPRGLLHTPGCQGACLHGRRRSLYSFFQVELHFGSNVQYDVCSDDGVNHTSAGVTVPQAGQSKRMSEARLWFEARKTTLTWRLQSENVV